MVVTPKFQVILAVAASMLLCPSPSQAESRESDSRPGRTEHAWDLKGPVKEPKYQHEPRYALLVFGSEREKRVWMALDGLTLIVDRDADGDLTEQGETLKPTESTPFANPGSHTHMNTFEFTVGSGQADSSKLRFQHWVRAEQFTPRTEFDKKIHGKWLELRHENGTLWRLDGQGRGQTPLIFMPKTTDAHVCALDGPLTFIWKKGQSPSLRHGNAAYDLAFHIGVVGLAYRGSDSELFNPLTTSEVPADAHLQVQIEYPAKTMNAPPVRQDYLLKLRC